MTKLKAKLIYSSNINVELVGQLAGDEDVIKAAKVSTLNDLEVEEMDQEAKEKFITFLMKNRHGSPFEHNIFKWRIKAPIFVWREFMRHRIASYNEQSGRYTVLPPEFYLPTETRNLVQVGKPGAYSFIQGTSEQYAQVIKSLKKIDKCFYKEYEALLDLGIAKEVSRMGTPVNLFSTAYVAMNARGLMNFLSLRVKSEDSTYESFPMWEINSAAIKMEDDFTLHMPITHFTFVKYGRVQP